MAKIELSLATNYVRDWGLWEGIREIIQNGKDAELEFNAPMVVAYDQKKRVLSVENEGCVIPHEALLLGHTTKADRPGFIGKKAEGLKLGMLCLVRAGHEVTIRSGGEVWTPKIERSSTFNADVLTVRIEGGRKAQDRVRVEIGDLDSSDWATFRKRFLFIDKDEAGRLVHVPDEGDILLADHMKGRIYVRGIFVCCRPDLTHGYNFTGEDVQLDRDRKMVDSYDLKYRTGRMWRYASNPIYAENAERAKQARERLVEMVFDDSFEIGQLADGVAGYLDNETREAVAARFAKDYGKDAHPVTNISDAADLESIGLVGVHVPKALAAVVETKLGVLAVVKDKAKSKTKVVFNLHDLTDAERKVLTDACSLLELSEVAEKADMTSVSIVEFVDVKTSGLFRTEDRAILVARAELESTPRALTTLIHELAHKSGRGGHDGAFVDQIERYWQKVLAVAITLR